MTPGGEPVVEQRRVSYTYDGLHRLTEATETPGTAYRYSYDLVGNRTEVWHNGVRTQQLAYNAANQVIGLSYDAAGNLLSDGTRALTYDALHRLSSATVSGTTTSYRYNGDGVLAAHTRSGTTTTYAQDLVAPLSQVLEINPGGMATSFRYGHQRLAAVQGSRRTWDSTDALGSIRQTLSDTGTASDPTHYDPWGTPTTGSPALFGFTGELHDAASGLVHVRARWYLPASGVFASRDPFAGFAAKPYSLHPYQYGYSNPVLHTDPSGRCSPSEETWGCDTPVTAANFGAQLLAVMEEFNISYDAHHAANRPSATIAVFRFLDRHPTLAQRYDPQTDPTLRQVIQRSYGYRDADETIAQLLSVLGTWRLAHLQEGQSGWSFLGLIAARLPIDIEDCLPFRGVRGSLPSTARSPSTSFDDAIEPRARPSWGYSWWHCFTATTW